MVWNEFSWLEITGFLHSFAKFRHFFTSYFLRNTIGFSIPVLLNLVWILFRTRYNHFGLSLMFIRRCFRKILSEVIKNHRKKRIALTLLTDKFYK
ncbi:hypothetical protein EF405_18695 [Cyclobacteriaceae bacterium YHN15]|nr:hypothetical protein EF405_18695 [Cyclobacteriaceae bacterium YHN15]